VELDEPLHHERNAPMKIASEPIFWRSESSMDLTLSGWRSWARSDRGARERLFHVGPKCLGVYDFTVRLPRLDGRGHAGR